MSIDLALFNSMAEEISDMVLEKIEFRLKVLLNGYCKELQRQLDDIEQSAGDLDLKAQDIGRGIPELQRAMRRSVRRPTLPANARAKALVRV